MTETDRSTAPGATADDRVRSAQRDLYGGPDLRYNYGQRVRVKCTATGRYVVNGWALVVSAMDNSLFLDRPTDAEPWANSPVPSDDALAGAHAVLTSSAKLVREG
jgi:hypothetical protein